MKNAIATLYIFLLIGMQSVLAQDTGSSMEQIKIKRSTGLEGLRKAEPGDIDPSKPLMMDPRTMPMYYADFTPVPEGDFMKIMMEGTYVPEPYIDSAKEVRAFVLRKATAEEQARMAEMQSRMQQDEGTSKKVGDEALDFSVNDIRGNAYTLSELRGKVVVVNFWFVECKPCVMEIPELNRLADKYAGKNVVFLGLATNDQGALEKFLKQTPFKYNLVPSSKEIVEQYGVAVFPTHLVIDQRSMIAYQSSGLGPDTIRKMDDIITKLIKK